MFLTERLNIMESPRFTVSDEELMLVLLVGRHKDAALVAGGEWVCPCTACEWARQRSAQWHKEQAKAAAGGK